MRTTIPAAVFAFIVAAFCLPAVAQSQPAFLFLLEGRGTPTGTIHVFSVNSSTGAVTEVPGSPFNAGFSPNQLVVDPTGRFVYVTNDQSEDVTGFSVDASTGALTELPGSPYLVAAQPVTSGIDPTGRFLYVFATTLINGLDYEYLYEYTIDGATGVLTPASAPPAPWEYGQGVLIVSIAFDPQGNYAYLGQAVGGNVGEPAVICSVDFSSGALTAVGAVQIAGGEADHLTVAPSGSFLYSTDVTFNRTDAFGISPQGGSLFEISGSPYPVPNNPSSLAVHPSGKFLYVSNANQSYQTNLVPSQYDGSISAFDINAQSGALTQLANSPVAAGINPNAIVADPSGRFVYAAATRYTSGYTGFAQILGYSIDPASGNLTPFSGPAWTDSVVSLGGGLAISPGVSTTLNPVPLISSLSPSSATATAVGFTLQVNGANFAPGATVYYGGQPRATTFVNSNQLNATILASDVDNGGTAVVFVFNPLPGGELRPPSNFRWPIPFRPFPHLARPRSLPGETHSRWLWLDRTS